VARPWTEQEVHRLRVLAKKKNSADEIARSLGRHIRSVKKKARELNLIIFKKVETKWYSTCRDSSMDWPDYLRDQAAMYRQLAEQVDDPVVKHEMLELASVC
jgi:hypothetical protein